MPRRKQKGDGLLDMLKKAAAVAKQVSDVTGIKPSTLLAAKGPYGALASSVLASQGLGKKKAKKAPKKKAVKRGGCQSGNGFWQDFQKGFAMPFQAIGDLGAAAVGGLMGNGKKGMVGNGRGPYPNNSPNSASTGGAYGIRLRK